MLNCNSRVRTDAMSATNDELAAAFEGRHTVDQTAQLDDDFVSLCNQSDDCDDDQRVQ